MIANIGQEPYIQIDKNKYPRFVKEKKAESEDRQDSPRRRNYRINVKARCAKLFWGRNYVWKLARSAKGRGKRKISVGKSWRRRLG